MSGGGPNAVACACLLGDRVRAAAVVSGVAPALDQVQQQAMWRDKPVKAVRALRDRLMCELQVYVCRRWPGWAIDQLVKQLAPADVAVMRRAEVRNLFEIDSANASRTTGRAIVQDLRLDPTVWEIDLDSIAVPVHIWHGRDDKTVPIERARALSAAIPTSTLRELEGTGHFVILGHLAEIVAALQTV